VKGYFVQNVVKILGLKQRLEMLKDEHWDYVFSVERKQKRIEVIVEGVWMREWIDIEGRRIIYKVR